MEVVEVVKLTRLLIPDSSSRIAALARIPNPEQQACRELCRRIAEETET
jgi:hypothetical protein